MATKATAQEKYNIQYVTTENGLPSDGIQGLQWDEQTGFLWVATELGLVRYNGSNFLIFNKENVKYLRSEKIFPLSKDLRGNIYAVNSGNIFRVFSNTLSPVGTYSDQDKNDPGLLNIYISKELTGDALLHVNDYYDRFLPLDTSHCLIQSHDTVWMYNSGSTKKNFLTPLPQDNPTFVIGKKVFSFDGIDQFSGYDPVSHKFRPVAITQNISSNSNIPGEKKHIYWQAGMDCPVVLFGANAWILKYTNGKILPVLICSEVPRNSSIKYAQYWEKGNILFLGTASKGIMVIRKNYLQNIKKKKSGFDEPNAIYSQILLSNGNILANTGDVLGPSNVKPKDLPVKGPFHNNTFITRDSLLWYTNRDSLYHYSYKTKATKYIANISGSLYLAFAVTENNLYVANGEYIYQLKNDSLLQQLKLDKTGDPFDMAELQPGALALATSKGLYKIDLHKKTIDTLIKKKAAIRSLWKYKSYLLIGTYGDGIYICKDNKIKKIPLDNNFYLQYTHCFMLDSAGYCWMSTNRGLFKAALYDLLNAFENNTQYVYYQFFGTNEGMDITEMNGGCTPCGIRLQNNDISFPTMDGALWVDPSMPVRTPWKNIFIDQVTVNGKKTDSSLDHLFFDANTHDVSFSLGFSAWCDKENIYLAYYLGTKSPQWQKIDVQHPVVHLSNLPFGKYDLYIRELSGFGQNNFSIKKLSFEIEAPWFLRWWGEAIIISLFGAIMIIISTLANRRSLRQQRRLKNQLDKTTKEILNQNEKLEKNDRIKTRLISIISHDIITPLKYLHLTTKYLAERKTSLPENLRNETLDEVVNTSRELELLSTNILNWIKYQNEERRILKEAIDLHDTAEQVFNILRSLAARNNIALVNNIPSNTNIFQLVEPIRIVLYNLTVNAINFTREGSITISSSFISGNIQVEVKDTGLGMPIAQIKNILSDHVIISSANVNKRSGHGLGYLIIKDLLKMIGGEMYIESRINVGTSVYIVFPVS